MKPELRAGLATHLSTLSRYVANDWRTPSGDGISCRALAREIAYFLLLNNERPELWAVEGATKVENGWVKAERLVPRRFAGRVDWGAHIVCVNRGEVLDAMIGYPVTTEAYLGSAFGRPVGYELETTTDELVASLKKRELQPYRYFPAPPVIEVGDFVRNDSYLEL